MLKDKSMLKIDEKLNKNLLFQREYSVYHLEYEKEMAFYKAVQNGDFDLVKKIMLPLKDSKLGKLSQNKIKNLKYHLIISTALITRFCIEGGMNPETAYTLSDIYIQQADVCSTEEEISVLHQEMIYDFTFRMKEMTENYGLSAKIVKAIDYIYDNLQTKISLDKMALFLNINKNYLCELFKKETGITIKNPVKVGYIEFPSKNFYVHVFKSTEFSGTIKENEAEVDAFWQDADNIPYQEMREADRDFLPEILAGKCVNRRYIYDENFHIIDIVNL